jgi:uncharacterized membrane protein YuzA (DUF378 family)
MNMRIVNIIAYVLVIVGAVNWDLFGLFDFNLVSSVFSGARTMGSVIVYTLIAIAALWLILSPFITDGVLWLKNRSRAE